MLRPASRCRTVLLAATILGSAAAPAGAQSPTAGIRGVLLDAEGLPAVGYQVVLHGATGDLFLSPPTGKDGAFHLAGLPPGRYEVSALDPHGEEFAVGRARVDLEAGRFTRVELRIAGRPHPPGREPPAATGSPEPGARPGRPWLRVALPAVASAAVALLLSGDGERPVSRHTP